ncbi:MAG: ATP-binding cassette domain-containing protein [Bacteroidota bacterium]
MQEVNLTLEGIGKKFYQRWLFRSISSSFQKQGKLALVGSNGSGKSTLMRIIAGQMSPSEGKLILEVNGKKVLANEMYNYISWNGPYIETYLDLSLAEQLDLHFSWKNCLLPSIDEVIDHLNLRPHKDKRLRYFSSGMLQRAMVGMTLLSDTPILLLDEPTSFMDEDNAAMILEMINRFADNRIFILASNMHREFGEFEKVIRLGG